MTRDNLAEVLAEVLGNDVSRYKMLRAADRILARFALPGREEPRVETGPVQFDDDWPGLFIRGDDAFGFAASIEAVLASDMASLTRSGIVSLLVALRSCNLARADHATPRRLRLIARDAGPKGQAVCGACGLPYGRFGIDCVLPDDQWQKIAPDNGLMCGGCMVAALAKVPHGLVVRMRLESAGNG